MNILVKTIKRLYERSNTKWHKEQQTQTAITNQVHANQYKQYLANVGQQALLFFRPILGQITYFDSASMRCDVTNIIHNCYQCYLQVPRRVSSQTDLPNNTTLQQLIENLLTNECIQHRNNLMSKVYDMQFRCCSLFDIMKYNQQINDCSFYFMDYKVNVHNISDFKVTLVVECRLDTDLMNSFFLY